MHGYFKMENISCRIVTDTSLYVKFISLVRGMSLPYLGIIERNRLRQQEAKLPITATFKMSQHSFFWTNIFHERRPKISSWKDIKTIQSIVSIWQKGWSAVDAVIKLVTLVFYCIPNVHVNLFQKWSAIELRENIANKNKLARTELRTNSQTNILLGA